MDVGCSFLHSFSFRKLIFSIESIIYRSIIHLIYIEKYKIDETSVSEIKAIIGSFVVGKGAVVPS